MNNFIGYALLAALAVFVIWRLFLKIRFSPVKTKPNLPLQNPVRKDFLFAKKSFEEKYNTGPLHCDGVVCNAKIPCSKLEILACRDIISKVIPNGYFKGQFWIELPCSGSRRVDFAIEMQTGKRIVVEIDGYEAHTKLERSEFNEALLRQNELICKGWTVLRFSFGQVINHAVHCREILCNALNPSVTEKFTVHHAKGLCPNSECSGEAYRCRNNSNGELFWKCEKCEQKFDNNKISPMPRKVA